MTPRGTFGRDALVAAFERIGQAAVTQGVLLDLFVYGGSALMLASNFRYATEDVDVDRIADPWPVWLLAVTAEIASENGWTMDWLNEAVAFHLSPLADRATDHRPFASFPGGGAGEAGLRVSVPSAPYMLALKLKAMRINDPSKGPAETEDIRNLLRVNGVRSIDEAIEILGRFFPRSAKEPDRQRFFLRHIWPRETAPDDPPRYPLDRR
jgi:hypothetical protein